MDRTCPRRALPPSVPQVAKAVALRAVRRLRAELDDAAALAAAAAAAGGGAGSGLASVLGSGFGPGPGSGPRLVGRRGGLPGGAGGGGAGRGRRDLHAEFFRTGGAGGGRGFESARGVLVAVRMLLYQRDRRGARRGGCAQWGRVARPGRAAARGLRSCGTARAAHARRTGPRAQP